MRPSSRNQILEAAVRVTERGGITALTLEAAAEEAGLTKAGLMYHFRTREELLLAIQRHLTDAWEERLLATLGKPLAEATARERAAVYARADAHGGTSKAELAFLVESASHPELAEPWNAMADRWVPEPSGAEAPDTLGAELTAAGAAEDELGPFLSRLAADGLWLFEATTHRQLTPAAREELLRRIAALAEPPG